MKIETNPKPIIPVESVNVIKAPGNQDTVIVETYVDVTKIPNHMPTQINPRETNMQSKVAKQLVAGLLDTDSDFFINNRGITINAKSVENTTNEVTIDFGTPEENIKYGILDGGHTYRAILDHQQELKAGQQFVHVQILVNVHDLKSLVTARNNSVQVNETALAELDDRFELIKSIIKGTPLAGMVRFKQNGIEPIDVIKIIRLMYAFKSNDKTKAPIDTYANNAKVLKDYLRELDIHKADNQTKNPYYQMQGDVMSILKLYDRIELDFANTYTNGLKKSHLDDVKGVNVKSAPTTFFNKPNDIEIAEGIVVPLVSAFRILLNDDYQAEDDLFAVWQQASDRLVDSVVSHLQKDSLAKMANSKLAWNDYTSIVDNTYKSRLLDKLIAEKNK